MFYMYTVGIYIFILSMLLNFKTCTNYVYVYIQLQNLYHVVKYNKTIYSIYK